MKKVTVIKIAEKGVQHLNALETKKIPHRVWSPRVNKLNVSMKVHAQTERLTLREWTYSDVDEYAEIIADPEVMKFIGNGEPRPRAMAEDFVVRMVQQQEDRGWNRFAVEHRKTGALVGFSGLDMQNGLLDFGWRLGREFWGAGYGFEASAAALWIAQNTFSLTKITAQSFPENVGSVRIMEKMGMAQIGEDAFQGKLLLVYGFAQEWPDGLTK